MSESTIRRAAHAEIQGAIKNLAECIEDSLIAHQALRAITDLMLPDAPGLTKTCLDNVERGDLWSLLGVVSDRMSDDLKRVRAAAEKARLTTE